jgi:tetratricopeptide (TPR) repeat protein
MTRWTIKIMVFLFYIFLSCQKTSIENIIQRNKPAVVTIITFGLQYHGTYGTKLNWGWCWRMDSLCQGSGFFINSHGYVVTNYHVLKDADSALIKTIDNKYYSVTGIIAEDRTSDVVVIATNAPTDSIKYIKVTSKIPKEGENIIVIGSPLGLELTISNGIISSLRDIENFGKIIQITAPISPGSSGGPVIDAKGKVVGIASFQIVGGQNLNFAIPGERINTLQLRPFEIKNLVLWTAEHKINEVFLDNELIGRGDFLLSYKNDLKASYTYFKKALERDPYNADVYYELSYYYQRCSLYNDAEENIKKAIKLQPNNEIYYYGLASMKSNNKNYEEAIKLYNICIKLSPLDQFNYDALAGCYYQLGRYNEAINALSKSIIIAKSIVHRNNSYSQTNLADMYLKANRKNEAILECRKAINGIMEDLKMDRYEKSYPYVYLTPQRINSYYWFELDTLLYAPSVVTYYDIQNSYLSHVYCKMGEIYCEIGDTDRALKIYEFLENRDTLEAKHLHESLYPTKKQINTDTLIKHQ